MTIDHEVWDARFASRIDDLKIETTADIRNTTKKTITSLRCYGFALLDGLCDQRERELMFFQLLKFARPLGTVVQQSPQDEEVEDVRDFLTLRTRTIEVTDYEMSCHHTPTRPL
ncbi:MAG: hypothetical protein OEQ39_01320 [Gammaproteobacteria bacterium]|nr:hypothetical protein [Gammaproteobacteria bacterium]MDH3466353.1 hypothetical protein [Gammaproteobacteria bacterium]